MTRRFVLPEALRGRSESPPGTIVAGAQMAGVSASDGVVDLYATDPVARRLIRRLTLEADPHGRLAFHIVSLPTLPDLSDRERLALAWCDLADRADPAADVVLEALWPGSIDVARIADVRVSNGQIPYTALRGVVDWTVRHPHLAEPAIRDRPHPTGVASIDSLLAGVAETIAHDHSLARPTWTAHVAEAPVKARGMVDATDERWSDVPAPLAERGIGVARETFGRSL